MSHTERHPLSGQTVTVNIGNGPEQYQVEDWWDHLTGGSWMLADGNPAALGYAIRTAFKVPSVPTDDEVVYGKIGGLGYLVHVSEILPAGATVV